MSALFSCLRWPLGLTALLLLSGCGQKGPLYLPQEPAAAERATLPQSVFRPIPRSTAPQPEADPPVRPAPTAAQP